MSALNVQTTGQTPITMQAAAGGGDTFQNTDGLAMFKVIVGATPTSITFHSVPCSHGRTKDLTVALSANSEYIFGPFTPGLYTDPTTGNVSVTYTSVATVTVGAFRNAQQN